MSSEQTFKLVIVGAESVGKTSILNAKRGRKCNPKEIPTEAAKEVNIKVEPQELDKEVFFNCFDLPGKESLMALNRIYIRDANIALIVYSRTCQDSME